MHGTYACPWIEKAHEGDKAARDTLAEENMGLVWSMVRRFANRGVEMEDLCQDREHWAVEGD